MVEVALNALLKGDTLRAGALLFSSTVPRRIMPLRAILKNIYTRTSNSVNVTAKSYPTVLDWTRPSVYEKAGGCHMAVVISDLHARLAHGAIRACLG
jgi:hypothetical protein